ncbi:expressed unknown protein [Seminavis robusta]|uniref:2'-5'-oligoadenylate synthetase 1 domain-containing protein n=1 Tax=Seminavis robusta TaxID=568900 RepID=A0A9N8EGE0_9STRA|nr:expressed unknown protein [Seminavis robusta]|eukprot:Sro1041_g234560.1 n/a (308) ;mRNA; f:15656-16720
MAEYWDWFDCDSKSAQTRYVYGLRPDKDDIRNDRSALAKVAHCIHTHVKSSEIPIQLVKTCGSVGKNTDSSISSDLDLVIFIDELKPHELANKISGILDKIQDAMDEQYPGTRDEDWYRKFGLRYVIAGMEIDILIGCTTVKPKDFLTVDDANQRAYMSASASRYATNFMKKQGRLFKDLVRVAKDWRDSFPGWPNQCKPKSYLLEVLMLHSCRQARPRFFVKKHKKNTFKQSIRTTPNLVAFFMLQFFDMIGNIITIEPKVTRHATALVLDPANPTNNLWLTLADPTLFINRAKKTAELLREEMEE